MSVFLDNLTSLLKHWQVVNLTSHMKEWDKEVLEIIENQKEFQGVKRTLSEKTKEFKKLDNEIKLSQLPSLLKAYQQHIDSYSKRLKEVEQIFISVYQLFTEAPDPVPILIAAVENSNQLVEIKKRADEIPDLIEKISYLSKKEEEAKALEEMVNHLEEKLLETENSANNFMRQKVLQKELEVEEKYQTKIKDYDEREETMKTQLLSLQNQLSEVEHSLQQTQNKLNQQQQHVDEKVIAKLAELDLTVLELEKANAKIIQKDSEIMALKENVKDLNSKDSETTTKITDFEMNELQNEVRRLEMECSKLQSEMTECTNWKNQKNDFEYKLVQKDQELENLKKELATYNDYNTIKNELEILKEMEFSSELSKRSENVVSPVHALEKLLITKNKRLQNELTSIKNTYHDCMEELSTTKNSLAKKCQEAEEQKRVIINLEEGLSSMEVKHQNVSEMSPTGILKPSDSGSEKENSLLSLIVNQRDRFKRRNSELEEILSNHIRKEDQLSQKLTLIEEDNLKLYEKIRFLTTYSSIPSESKSTYIDIGVSKSRTSGGVPALEKYKKMYEETMDPFRHFYRQELGKSYQALSTPEKATLNLSRFFLSTKYTRTFIFLYFLALHLLVLGTLYKLSMVEECQHNHEVHSAILPGSAN